MLYLSIFLAASGIIFIIITLIKSVEKEPGSTGTDGKNILYNDLDFIPPSLIDEDIQGHYLKEDISNHEKSDQKIITENFDFKSRQSNTGFSLSDSMISGDDDFLKDLNDAIPVINDDQVKILPIQKELDKIPVIPDNYTEPINAVLYEDASNLIDYKNIISNIDTTFDSYKKIKRIGEGKIEICDFGINFKTGKNQFRFDSHRISEIWSGSNYFALSVKGSDKIKLFLITEKSVSGNRLKELLFTGNNI
jgi:hypothetical protein